MVKIHNVFGDKWYGKQQNMVYQRKGDYVVRRLDPDKNDAKSPTQLQQRNRFKIATNSWKQLTNNDKAGLENYFKNELTQYEQHKFLHMYNMFKAYRMRQLSYKYNISTKTITITFEHPFIKSVAIYDLENNIISTSSNNITFSDYQLPKPIIFNINKDPSFATITYLDNTTEQIPLSHIKIPIEYGCPLTYTLLADYYFSSYTPYFTVSNIPSNAKAIRIIGDGTLQYSATFSDNAILLYPNNRQSDGYDNVNHQFTAAGTHAYVTNQPTAAIVLTRTSWRRTTFFYFDAVFYPLITGSYRITSSDTFTHTAEGDRTHLLYISSWKNTSTIVNSITIKAYNNKLRGRYIILWR